MEQVNNTVIEKKRIFISHSSKDYIATNMKECFCEPLEYIYDVVCSTKNGIHGYLHDKMNEEIHKCDIFFALITENYIRSPHCLYELAVARYVNYQRHLDVPEDASNPKEGEMILVYINDDIKERIKDIAITELTSTDLKGGKNIERSVNSLISELQLNNLPDINEKITNFLKSASLQSFCDRPYVGMSESTYNHLLRYCEKESIIKFGTGSIYSQKEMDLRCKKSRTLYIVSTTGAGLLKTLKEAALRNALVNKAQINIIIPDRGSLFCKDVAEAECCRDGYNEVIEYQNKHRIESEFEATIQYLNEAYCLAQKEQKELGKIIVYSSRTLLRQTLFLTVADDDSTWGWITMTMVPLRTAETPSIAISDTNAKEGLDKAIIKHCEALISMARKYNAFREINGRTIANPLETPEKSDQEQYWINKREIAKAFMQERKDLDKILIEVASQHPLNRGESPKEEFKTRLDTAVKLSKELGEKKVWFYIPGSRHKHNGVEDKISLSEAGKNYLLDNGVNANNIYADDANSKYKGEQGVYNSADESFVASQLFKDENFGRMICVCSPYQIMRKAFYYLEFGIIPECYSVPCKDMYHDPISEYFGSLHHTVIEDHNWQCEESEAARNSRIDRKV